MQSWYWSRVLVAALTVFFPILINSIAGLRSVPREFYDLMHSLRATRGQTFRKLEWPAALPTVLAALSKRGAGAPTVEQLDGLARTATAAARSCWSHHVEPDPES